MTYLRRLYLFFELRKVVKCSLIHGESVFLSIPIKAKYESGSSKDIHFERHRSLAEGVMIHSKDTK